MRAPPRRREAWVPVLALLALIATLLLARMAYSAEYLSVPHARAAVAASMQGDVERGEATGARVGACHRLLPRAVVCDVTEYGMTLELGEPVTGDVTHHVRATLRGGCVVLVSSLFGRLRP